MDQHPQIQFEDKDRDTADAIKAYDDHLFLATTNTLEGITFQFDARIKDMFEEAFKAGMAYENDTYEPDFETWFAAAVERWRNA